MNTTANAPTVLTKFNANRRAVESMIETSVPGVFLTITTTHSNKTYWSRLDRVQIEDGILTMKIDNARFTDKAPITPRRTEAARYSAKNVQAAHDEFLPLVEGQLAEAMVWAERY